MRTSSCCAGLLITLLSLGVGCSGDDSEGSADGAGGAQTSVGGTTGTGGSTNSGGTGGAVASGGVVGSGGVGSGGAGGASETGGQSGTGAATSTGGASGTGATSGTGGGTAWFPCDADPSTYDVTVIGSGSNWTVAGGNGGSENFTDMQAAMAEGYSRLTAGRTTKESMLVQGDGTIDANAQLRIPGFITLNICGTIEVTGTASQSDRSPLYARGTTDIDIPNARITGNPQYGMFFRQVSNIHLGNIELATNKASSGIGVRIDNNPNGGGAKVTNIQVDHITATGTGSHAIETYGVDGIDIGRVDGTDLGECGVLLNNTVNAEVGVVHCENCAAGTGYAAFRIANDAGKIGTDWPAGNIHVGEVYARGGGRGIFSVSGSGGLTIDQIDIADTGNNPILLQNCINTTIAAESGTVSKGSVILSNDTDNTNSGKFEPSRNVKLQNLTLSNGATVSEAWCDLGDRNNRASNITGGSVDMCF